MPLITCGCALYPSPNPCSPLQEPEPALCPRGPTPAEAQDAVRVRPPRRPVPQRQGRGRDARGWALDAALQRRVPGHGKSCPGRQWPQQVPGQV